MMSATDEVDVHRMGNLIPGIRLFQKLVEHRRHFLNAKEGPAVAYTVELICSPFNVPCC